MQYSSRLLGAGLLGLTLRLKAYAVNRRIDFRNRVTPSESLCPNSLIALRPMQP
jgi:hypothetical protein